MTEAAVSFAGNLTNDPEVRYTESGIARVVFAWREPTLFVEGRGAELLAAAGVEVVEVPQLAESAREANQHLFAR